MNCLYVRQSCEVPKIVVKYRQNLIILQKFVIDPKNLRNVVRCCSRLKNLLNVCKVVLNNSKIISNHCEVIMNDYE